MRRTIDAYLRLLAEMGRPHLNGLYIVGSVALGDFQEGRSDIDFVAVLAEPPDLAAIDALARVHQDMASRDPQCLDGVYATAQRLCTPSLDTLATPFVVEGRFHSDRACGDLNAVLRQCLVEHGLSELGPPAATFGVKADRIATARYVRGNLASYWRGWVDQAAKAIDARRPDAGVDAAALSWGALGVARIAATLETGDIVSKSAAGRWALDRFHDRREPLELALAQRHGKLARASLDDAGRTLAFMRFVIARYAA